MYIRAASNPLGRPAGFSWRTALRHAMTTIDATLVSSPSRNANANRAEFSVIKHGNTRRYAQYRASANATAIADTREAASVRASERGERKAQKKPNARN